MTAEKPKVENDSVTMLGNIHRGVAIILWAVLTHTFVWPIGSAISGARNESLLSYGVMTWAVPTAMVLAYLATRLVFPISYPNATRHEGESS